MTLAEKMMEYIKRRAAVEGVGFDLPLDLFEDCVEGGVNPVFGVYHDGEKMLSDAQEPYPGFFAENNGQSIRDN
jgi:hypothetical protein